MTWLTWRQSRIQTMAVYVAVAVAAAVFAVTGRQVAALARVDRNVYDRLTKTDFNLYHLGLVLVALAPAVIGAFWGAPLVARELETGTYRLAWNQSVTRTRWLATKLAVTAVLAAVAVAVLTWAVTWWAGPLDGAQSNTQGSIAPRLTPGAFAMRGIAPIGYVVFALVLGVAVGLVVRRALPAVAITLALFAFVQVAVPNWVRPHLLKPVQQNVAFSASSLDGIRDDGAGRNVQVFLNTGGKNDWLFKNETVNSAGRQTAVPAWFGACLQTATQAPTPQPVERARAKGGLDTCLNRLTTEGYRQQLSYLPASRFWALQRAETALFLGLAGLLTLFCFWWTRRRLT